MGEYSKVEIDGRLMIVTINRPEVYNACHPMANQELVDAFDAFHADPELWVASITGVHPTCDWPVRGLRAGWSRYSTK